MAKVNKPDIFGSRTGAEVAVNQVLEKESDRSFQEGDNVVQVWPEAVVLQGAENDTYVASKSMCAS